MSESDSEMVSTHITIREDQKQRLEDEHINLSSFVRSQLDKKFKHADRYDWDPEETDQ